MSSVPLQILQNPEVVHFAQYDYDDLRLHYDYHLRVARARWLKHKFGKIIIPRDLFAVVVDADVVLEVLDRWFDYGGLNCVYYRCKSLFGGGDDVDCSGIREVQDEIDRRNKRTFNIRGQASTVDRTFAFDLPAYSRRSEAGGGEA